MTEHKKYTFIHPDPELKNNLMAFYFECGQGWYPLIFELFDKLQDKINESPDEYLDFEILQVKEKFGMLTIYCYYHENLEKMIEEYCKMSLKVCELCGSKEDVSMKKIYGWYTTICNKCFVKG